MKSREVGVILTVVCATFCAGVAQAVDPAPVRATPAQITKAQASTQFKEALQILDEQDEAVNLKTVRVVTVPKKIGTSALHFDITRKGSATLGEFQRLVYVERAAKPPLVYFDLLTGIAALPSFCITKESGWKTIITVCGGGDCGRECDRYALQERSCVLLSGGIRKEQRRIIQSNCGCRKEECSDSIDL
ncbi:MAG TPA: hypothetical protein VGF48_23095 [Thermoanaerobaculia bacterium]|jgi:hypothetical protein